MVNLSPKLRFPEFSGNWKSKKLEEVGSVINGLTYSPDDIHDDGVLVLRSSNIKENQLSFNDNVYVNTDNYNPVRENDILICVRNGSRNLIGKNALITKEAEGVAFGAFMSVYRSELNKFVFQLFATDTYYKIIQENLGATINSINNSDLKKFEFFFPLKEEQDKIAVFLSEVDTKINQLSKKKKLLEQYKKGVMQKIFNQEIRFKDDNSSDYPDWTETIFNEVIDRISTGLNPRKNFILGKGNNYYVTIKNISDGKLDFTSCEMIDDDALKLIKKRSDLSKGDIIMSSIGNIGEAYLLKQEPTNWNINESVFMLRAKKELIIPLFLYYTLSNELTKQYFENNMTGSSFKSIKVGDLKLMPIVIPSLEEQDVIAEFLLAIDDKINQVNTQLKNTKNFKKGLLQQMFV